MREVGRGPRESDRQRVPAGDDTGCGLGLALEDAPGTHHVARQLKRRRVHLGGEDAVDRTGEGARSDRGAVTEPEPGAKRERVGLAVAGNGRGPRGHFGLELETCRRRLVRVRHQASAGRVQQCPAGRAGCERRVHVVDPGERVQAYPEDPALLLRARRRSQRRPTHAQREASAAEHECGEPQMKFSAAHRSFPAILLASSSEA